MYPGGARRSFENPSDRTLNEPDARPRQNEERSFPHISTPAWGPNSPQPELSTQLCNLEVSSDRPAAPSDVAEHLRGTISPDLERRAMDIVYRPDGFGQQHSKNGNYRNAGSSMFDHNERRPGGSHASEPVWPVPRMQLQNHPADRFRNPAHLTPSHADYARHQSPSDNYNYEAMSVPLRNSVVYSQPVQNSWGMGGAPSDYTYPTLPYMTSTQRQPGPYMSSDPYGDGGLGSNPSDGNYRLAHPSSAESSEQGEPLWPLAPNSLEAFAGIPAPPGSATRLTLTSAADRNKLKARSSLPPPKQFKCSACDAIFSRNHDLKRHARIHLAVKPFPCGYCDKAFSRKDALKRHVLVKGCGIGSKKPEGRRRSATLSKLEQGDGSASISSAIARGSRHESVFDTRSREYLLRDDHAHMQQGLSRSFPSNFETSTWNSGANHTSGDIYTGKPASVRTGFAPSSSHDSSVGADLHNSQSENSRDYQSLSQPLGHAQQYPQHAQPYAYEAQAQHGQFQHVGGLVTTHQASEDQISASPIQSRTPIAGMPVSDGSHPRYVNDPRHFGADSAAAQIVTPSLPSHEGIGQSKDRYGQAAFVHSSGTTLGHLHASNE